MRHRLLLHITCHKPLQLVRPKRSIHSQRPAESLACDRGLDAFEGGMHPGAPAGKSRGAIRDHLALSRDDPQQGGFIGTHSAAKTGSYSLHTRPTQLQPLSAPTHSMLPYLDFSP